MRLILVSGLALGLVHLGRIAVDMEVVQIVVICEQYHQNRLDLLELRPCLRFELSHVKTFALVLRVLNLDY